MITDETERPRGLTGLQNLGNTCYMNAAIQALSNCPQLTRFMLDCPSFVRKPGLAKTFMRLVSEIWSKKRPSYVVPSGIAHGIKSVCPVFKGYAQQDAQEFLRCFLDQLHEELKEAVLIDDQASDTFDSQGDEPSMSDDESISDGDYETCDSRLSSEQSAFGDDEAPSRQSSPDQASGSSLTANQHSQTPKKSEKPSTNKQKQPTYRSIISDVFDGRLISSVQCLTCGSLSATNETFQDLSLPIPNRDHLQMLRAAQSGKEASMSSTSSGQASETSSPALSRTSSMLSLSSAPVGVYHWVWEWVEWMLGMIWGPTVSLQDCLSAFFSADELKGDNMYSCEKCRKLRNGIKFSKVVQLPDVLSIHLKRFRHELMYSSKISNQVTFPLEGLDMSPFVASKRPSDEITTYDLVAVVCHHGTPQSGHYTAYCLNDQNETWYEFDDQYVTSVDPHQVASCEAYVLFYRKTSEESFTRRQKALELMNVSRSEPSLLHFFISKQWVNKFNTFANPGPISNYDFLCEHGSVEPDKASYVHELCMVISKPVWEYLHSHFGGGPTCTKLYVCRTCSAEKEQLDRRRKHEYDTFTRLNQSFTHQRVPNSVFYISMSWFNNWEAFVLRKSNDVPGPIDNSSIATLHPRNGQVMVKVGSDHATISSEMWQFLYSIYGGGPSISQTNRRANSYPLQSDQRDSKTPEKLAVETNERITPSPTRPHAAVSEAGDDDVDMKPSSPDFHAKRDGWSSTGRPSPVPCVEDDECSSPEVMSSDNEPDDEEEETNIEALSL